MIQKGLSNSQENGLTVILKSAYRTKNPGYRGVQVMQVWATTMSEEVDDKE